MKNKVLVLILLMISTTAFSQATAVDLNNDGIAALKMGDTAEGLELLTASIKMDSKSPVAYYSRGNAYVAQKNYKLAISDYTKALENGGELYILFARANAYRGDGNIEKAIADYTEVISQNSAFHSVYLERGLTYRLQQKNELAKKDFEKQLNHDTLDLKTLEALIDVNVKLKNYDAALMGYEIILLEYSNVDEAYLFYNSRANLYTLMQEYDKALLDLNKAIELKGDFALGIFNRAKIWMKMGDTEKACIDMNKILKLDIALQKDFQSDKDYEELKKLCN
ncbi:tetratricopeptide repeat protein [Flavobacterium sp. NKUCC04_CG]|uniref:tetratricopeptide repeat protein n=1 Tax=Flavobacterium sp. NKUCC04_CG TaxID=2842121 RepID=UPI001C5ADB62|nr:tetratricopeptide repeat protein [Flavobacterium sp. NKUCC04_CG]MBW3518433.1 tetratricopeptide repeat protein [Flavobacterium sp. NKUCC04_CG]